MTHALPSSDKLVARTRGQVMVLGCVSLLVMALMLMVSFNVTNAVHEKIRIQAHADAAAYSLAVVEARAFNTTAHYNRAIAATLVAQMSLHSWMAIATVDTNMLLAGSQAMAIIAATEAVKCFPGMQVACCFHAAMAGMDSFRFFMTYMDWGDKLEGLENDFNDGVDGLRQMASTLHQGQNAALSMAATELSTGGPLLAALKSKNAPRSDYVQPLIVESYKAFTCTLEGSGVDGSSCGTRSKSSPDVRSTVMQNTANAARPTFDKMGLQTIPNHSNFGPNYDPDVPKDQLTTGSFIHSFVATEANLGNKGRGAGSDKGDRGHAISAGMTTPVAMAVVINYYDAIPGVGMFMGEVSSDDSGGSHRTFFKGHSGQHDKFKGVETGDPCSGDQNCFVNFRAVNDANQDFGMPSVFMGVSQNLRLYQTKSGDFKDKAPWEVNDNGEISVELVKGNAAKVKMVPRETGHALAKAKAYFHQLGRWNVAPNLFDPFWRAKLHFFSRQELQTALSHAGDSYGIQVNTAGAPAEGEP